VAKPVAKVYVKLLAGDKLTLNGQQQDVAPAVNGFAGLSLAAGDYQIAVTHAGQTRQQKITVGEAGTWVINPQ
jgi:hypothetical protein